MQYFLVRLSSGFCVRCLVIIYVCMNSLGPNLVIARQRNPKTSCYHGSSSFELRRPLLSACSLLQVQTLVLHVGHWGRTQNFEEASAVSSANSGANWAATISMCFLPGKVFAFLAVWILLLLRWTRKPSVYLVASCRQSLLFFKRCLTGTF